MMLLLALDYDHTFVKPKKTGTVPLDIAKALVELDAISRDVEVWAIGNQKMLHAVPGIKGIESMRDQRGLLPPHCEIEPMPEDPEEHKAANIRGKYARMSRLSAMFPDAERIVVDDYDLSGIEGWTWLSPEKFRLFFAVVRACRAEVEV